SMEEEPRMPRALPQQTKALSCETPFRGDSDNVGRDLGAGSPLRALRALCAVVPSIATQPATYRTTVARVCKPVREHWTVIVPSTRIPSASRPRQKGQGRADPAQLPSRLTTR